MIIDNKSIIVVGAGLWGCTVARRLAERDRKIVLIEARDDIGGNAHASIDIDTGIEVHDYGSHIFHTSLPDVWNFIRQFSDFSDYRHKVISVHNGKEYHLPIGRTLITEFLGKDVSPAELTEHDRTAIFNAFIRGYTMKQWGIPATDVSKDIINRLKTRDSYSTDYFDDKYQGLPNKGYHRMFRNIVNHYNIKLVTNAKLKLSVDGTRLFAVESTTGSTLFEVPEGTSIYYSGALDSLFNYRNGELSWRSLKFTRYNIATDQYQSCAVVNYPDLTVDYTRVHEFKHYHTLSNTNGKTVIMYEYPVDWKNGMEKYYPVQSDASLRIMKMYKEEVENINRSKRFSIIVGGRLGSYKYLDMDMTIHEALDITL